MKKKTAIWLTIVSACFILLAAPGGAATQSTAAAADKVPAPADLTLALTSAAPPRPNGDFVVSVERQGRWQEVSRLSEDRFLREQRLDLSPWLPGGQRARVRIRQAGGGASHLDAVLLGGRAPLAASAGILKKISRRDNDLASSAGQSIDLTFAAGSGRELSLTGRIESTVIGTEPLQFPEANTFRVPSVSSSFYSYRLGSAPPPRQRAGSRAWLAEVGRRRPLFAVLAPTGSGHPAGCTYGWVSNDRRNLYVTIDFTLDNTYDGAKDYAKVYARCDGRLREFKVSVPERRWGRAHFTYTDKVAYQHKVYDFIIPLAELPGVAAGGSLDLCFAAYGTAAVMTDATVNLAYDPNRHRYLMVYSELVSSSMDVFGEFLAEDGSPMGSPFAIASDASNHEIRPDVAYDRVNRRFLVVWHKTFTSDGTEMLVGRICRDDGSLYTPDFSIMSSKDDLSAPALAFDEVNQRYLVTWALSRMPGFSWVRGQLRDSAGFLVSPPGFEINISPVDPLAIRADVAFDRHSQRYMVVWESLPSTPALRPAAVSPGSHVFGQMVAYDGALAGDIFTVSTAGFYNMAPTVANDSVNHRFLVAWVQETLANTTIVPAFKPSLAVSPLDLPASDIMVVDRLFDSLGAPIGDPHGIGLKPSSHVWPKLAFDPVHGRYLAIWHDIELPPPPAVTADALASGVKGPPFPYPTELVGQFLNSAGAPIGSDPAENFTIAQDSLIFFPPALASNTDCGNFLAAWMDLNDPGTFRDVIGGGCAELPTVTTAPVEAVTTTGATSGGTVTSDGGAQVTGRGVCWNTSGLPTLANAHSSDGGGSGSFASHLSGLLPDVSYRVRAYATNRIGTAYGNEVTFTTARWVVTFLADPGGTLSGTTPQYVANGGSCTPVQAIAQPGFFFRRWEGSNASSSLDDPLTVTNVNSDLAFTARFGLLGISAKRLIEHAWIIRAEYAEIELTVGGLADSGAAKFRLMRQVGGGDPEPLQEIAAGELKDGRTTFTSLPLDKGRSYTFYIEALDSAGALLGFSASVTI